MTLISLSARTLSPARPAPRSPESGIPRMHLFRLGAGRELSAPVAHFPREPTPRRWALFAADGAGATSAGVRRQIPKIFFGNFARVFFSECSGPAPPPIAKLPPSPPSRIHSSGGAQKKRGENFAARSFGFVAQAQVAGGGAFSAPPPLPRNSGVNSRGNSGGGIFNGITVPLIYPSRRPSAPSAERPAAPPAALRRGFARPGRRFAPGVVPSPAPSIPPCTSPLPRLAAARAGGQRRRRARCDIPRRLRGARTPRMPWQGRGASSPAQRDRESVLPPARPHSADSGEFKADALARRARQPVSTSYCTAQHLLLHRPPC